MNSLFRASMELRAIFVMREAMDISMLSLTMYATGWNWMYTTWFLRDMRQMSISYMAVSRDQERRGLE